MAHDLFRLINNHHEKKYIIYVLRLNETKKKKIVRKTYFNTTRGYFFSFLKKQLDIFQVNGGIRNSSNQRDIHI